MNPNLPSSPRAMISTTPWQTTHWFKEALPKSFIKGEYIYHQGDSYQGLYYIKKGIVALKHVSATGREYLLRFYKCQSIFGHRAMLSSEPYYASAVALEPLEVLFLPKEQAWDLFERNPHWYKELAIYLAKDLGGCEKQRIMISENQILARTAQALLYLKEFFPQRNWTRQEIAEYISSTATTVIKALAELERRGLIRQQGRRIDVLNREGLLAIPEDEVF
jgi:CRP-like cAMP-binding protein